MFTLTSPSKVAYELSDKVEHEIDKETGKTKEWEERDWNVFHERVRPFSSYVEHPHHPNNVSCSNQKLHQKCFHVRWIAVENDDGLNQGSYYDPRVPEVVHYEGDGLIKLLRIYELSIHGVYGPEQGKYGL